MHYCHAKATFQEEQRELTVKEWIPRPLFFSTATSHQHQHLCKKWKDSLNKRPKWARNRSPGLGWSWYVTLCQGGYLGCQIKLPLAIQNLMLFKAFQDCHHGHYLGYWNWTIQQFWISMSPNASHQVSAQPDLLFGRRCGLKNFKTAAIVDIGTERF